MDRKTFFEKAWTLAIGKGLSLLEENALLKSLEKIDAEPASSFVSTKLKQRPPGASFNQDVRVVTPV
jgi:hypothetical protein